MIFRDYQDFPAVKDPLPQESSTGVLKEKSKTQLEKEKKRAKKTKVVIEHVDIIQDEFWVKRPWILGDR